jgi:hypothetical protein|tara:strand:+ start:4277 stop:4681 length:405 start_codon:yes stop_codon:yes gene_type:complete
MTPSKVVDKIKEITKINPFVDSRKKEVVEIRALLCYVLREKMKMRWIAIKAIFLKNGRSTNNSTLIHAVENYKIYASKNKKLEKLAKKFNFKYAPIDQVSRTQILENRLRILEKKLRNCEKENRENIRNHVLRN